MSRDYQIEIHSWDEKVQSAVRNASKEVFELIDSGINKTDRFVIADYPYGANLCKYSTFHLPLENGLTCAYSQIPKSDKIYDILGEKIIMVPFSFLSKGCIEVFWETNDRIILRGHINAGSFDGFRTLLLHPDTKYDKEIWHATSGARTLALLPSIKDIEKYKRLKKTYNLKSPVANDFIKHAPLFTEICKAQHHKWHTQLIIFSVKTTSAIRHSKRFSQLRSTITKGLLTKLSFDGNQTSFNFIWDQFIRHIEQQGIKEYPHIYNLAKHLISVALGEDFAFMPAYSTKVAPIDTLAKAFVDIYKLRYFPSFIHAQQLKPNDRQAVYYSLQYQMYTNPFPIKRSVMTGLDDLRSVKTIHEMFMQYINENAIPYKKDDFIFSRLKNLKFSYFHTVQDGLKVISQSNQIAVDDPRFLQVPTSSDKPFCHSSGFFKGCVKIENTNVITDKEPIIIHPELKF